jgi:hypothetical protein
LTEATWWQREGLAAPCPNWRPETRRCNCKACRARRKESAGRYISPIAKKHAQCYLPGLVTHRGDLFEFHEFDIPEGLGGGKVLCNPHFCRECHREKHWRAGQTHAEACADGKPMA